MNYRDAYLLAHSIQDIVGPWCIRCEIGGSIRRGKANVKDIEIICQPDYEVHPVDLFGNTDVHYPIYDYLNKLFQAKTQARYLKGQSRYRQYALPQGINLDLFIVIPPAQWGVVFALRTGPRDFNKWLVTPRRSGGRMPSNAIMKTAGIYMDRQLISMPHEIDFLNFLGVGFIEPKDRAPQWGQFQVSNPPPEGCHSP